MSYPRVPTDGELLATLAAVAVLIIVGLFVVC